MPRGYSYATWRKLLTQRGVLHTIPEKRDQYERRSNKSERPLVFAKNYIRNVIERCINRLNQWHGSATHYEKRAVYFHVALLVVSLFDLLKN
jgi:transposase